MAANFTERIRELEGDRRRLLREQRRAQKRRRDALKKRKWMEARSALKVVRRKRANRRKALKRIRTLRSARGKARALARLLRHRRSAGKASDGGQLYWWTGRPVRASVYPHLVYAKKHGWRGVVTSGYRSPAYSQSLCRAMCGRNSCSGTCAGTGSNHVRTALDVSDYYTFGRLMQSCPHKPRIWNNLSRDRVHYSPNGV